MDNNLIKIAPALCMISTEDFEKHPNFCREDF